MKKEKEEIPSSCWNKYKEIHSEKILYINKAYDIFINLSKFLSEFDSKYKSLDIDNLVNPIQNNKINETLKLIHKSIMSFINMNETMIKNILNCFKDINKFIKDEQSIYEKVLLNYDLYNEEKEKMIQIKNTFIDKMRVFEDLFKSEIVEKSEIKIDKEAMGEALKDFEDYKIVLSETNKKRMDFNKSQYELLKFYQNLFMEKEANLYEKINANFYMVEKNANDINSVIVEKMKDKKKIDQKEYIKEIASLYLSKEKPEDEIKTISYNLKHKPFAVNNDCTPEEIIQATQISDEIIKKMRKYLSENFPNTDLQIQESLIELPDIINKFFDLELELTTEEKSEILKLIKDDIKIYPQMITLLSRLRGNSKLYKSRLHIEFLVDILNEILIITENKKDYDAAKNCILLSQTYFLKDEKTNQKTYLFEKIKNNKWINSIEFWNVLISNQLKKQFKRFESLYPEENLNLENNNTNIPQKYKGRVKEILFSCLLTQISNIIDLQIDKKIILKLLDGFINKYQYLDEKSINELYDIISPNKEEIIKLREEYQENKNF